MWFVPLISTVLVFFAGFFILRKRFSVKRYLEDINRELSGLTDDFNRNTDRNVTIIESKINDLKAQIEKSEKIILLMKKEISAFEETVKKREKIITDFDREKEKKREKTDSEATLFSGLSDYEKILSNKDNVILSMQAARVYTSASGKNKPSAGVRAMETGESEKNKKNEKKESENPPSGEDTPSGVDSGIREKVKELVSQGFTADFIADKLGVSVSEVNLILFMEK